jgi:hypothetical protein
MTRPLLLLLASLSLAFSTGCVFSKKHRTKESNAIAGEVEATFRKRWLEKRVGELTAQGKTADEARTQADAEFRERFTFAQNPKK